MKILHVIPYFNPKRGGDVYVCSTLARKLANRRNDVTIITTNFEFDKKYARLIEKDGVKIISFDCILNLGLFLFSPSIKKWLQANIMDYDIIHLHNFRSYQNNVVKYFSKKYNKPYVLQAHGLLPYGMLPKDSLIKLKEDKSLLKTFYDLIWGYDLLDNASKLLSLSNTETLQYKLMGADENKIEIFPNGLNLDEYCKIPKKGSFKRKHKIELDDKIILYLGRLHKTKGVDILVRMVADISKKNDRFKLVFIGPDDGYGFELKRLADKLEIGDKILFAGFVTNNEKAEAFVDADVFVTPSYGGFPITFLESCFYGTPIITTKKGDDLGWIQDKVGFVVEYDCNQIRVAIEKILTDSKLREKFSNTGKRLIQEKFNWDNLVGDLEKIYFGLIN